MGVPAEEPRTCAGASHACVFFLDIPRGTRVLPSMHLHGLRGAVIFPLSGAFLLRGSGVGHVASLAGSASFRSSLVVWCVLEELFPRHLLLCSTVFAADKVCFCVDVKRIQPCNHVRE